MISHLASAQIHGAGSPMGTQPGSHPSPTSPDRSCSLIEKAEVDAGGWLKVALDTAGIRATIHKVTSFQAPIASLHLSLLSHDVALLDASFHGLTVLGCEGLAPSSQVPVMAWGLLFCLS